MGVRIKCAIVLIILTLLGLGPLPITSVIGLYVVFARPRWFKDLVLAIYGEDDGGQHNVPRRNEL